MPEELNVDTLWTATRTVIDSIRDCFLIAEFTPDRIEVAHLARNITGHPPDLKPPALVRTGDDWQIEGTTP